MGLGIFFRKTRVFGPGAVGSFVTVTFSELVFRVLFQFISKLSSVSENGFECDPLLYVTDGILVPASSVHANSS